MSKHRVLSKKNKYYLPKEEFLTVVHFCKQYPSWKEEEQTIKSSLLGSPVMDDARVTSSNVSDPTGDAALQLERYTTKIDIIERTAKEVAGMMAHWLIEGTCYDRPYYVLKQKGIPCGKDLYYLMRRRFYYEVAQRI